MRTTPNAEYCLNAIDWYLAVMAGDREESTGGPGVCERLGGIADQLETISDKLDRLSARLDAARPATDNGQ